MITMLPEYDRRVAGFRLQSAIRDLWKYVPLGRKIDPLNE